MHTRIRIALAIAVVLLAGTAAKCFSITDPFVISVNVDDVTGVYVIDANTVDFDPDCTTRDAADYLDSDYELVGGGRLVDITVQTIGPFGGSIVGGSASVNGTPLVSYDGPWSTFNTPQSLLAESSPLTLAPAGVTALLGAIQNGQAITICHAGMFSEATPSGLQIEVKVYAQVDAKP